MHQQKNFSLPGKRAPLHSLCDGELLRNTLTIRAREKEHTLLVLKNLQEIYHRRLYADLKCKSIRDYCVRILGYSVDEAQLRVDSMMLMKDVPGVAEQLANGELSLTIAARTKRFFRREKIKSMGKKREVLAKIKNLDTRSANQTLYSLSRTEPMAKESVTQISATKSQLSITIDNETLELLEQIKGRFAHKYGSLTYAQTIKLLAIKEMQPSNIRETKRKKQKSGSNRTAAARVSRQVKSKGHCENCGSTYALEIDHRKPWAKGGTSTPENLRLLCRSCNQRSAIKAFGKEKMGRYLT